MMKRGYYPAFRVIEGSQAPRALAHLSDQYHEIECQLRRLAHEDVDGKKRDWPFSKFVFGCVVMRVSCMEAYFNEILAQSILLIETSDKYNDGNKNRLIRELIYVINKSLSKEKLRYIFSAYDKQGAGIDTEGYVYKDFTALMDIRHTLTHYPAEFVEGNMRPERLKYLDQRLKLPAINTDWTTVFSHVKIADWSYRVAKSVIEEFSQVSGADNPYRRPIGPIWTEKSIEWVES